MEQMTHLGKKWTGGHFVAVRVKVARVLGGPPVLEVAPAILHSMGKSDNWLVAVAI